MASNGKPSGAVGSGISTRRSSYSASVTPFEASLPSNPQQPSRIRNSSPLVHKKEEVVEHSLSEADIEDIAGSSKGKGKAKASSSTSRKRKEAPTPSKSPRKAKAIRLALDVPHPEPERWEETYAAIKEMRKNGGAPVDEMGCHMAGGPVEDPKTKRFVILVSLMLSSQTKDEVTHVAVSNLRTSLGELTVGNVLAADDAVISAAIAKVGFWRRKTQYIRQAAQSIQDDFDGEIPKTVDDLCSLPGVGPKMAFLALQEAWHLNAGIGVDVHVHRITNRLGWHKPPTKEPEQTRLNLQSWLPSDLHAEINPLLVGFGQTICLPVGPRCDACTLSAKGLCPSVRIGIKSKARKAVGKGRSIGAKVAIELEDSLVVSGPKVDPVEETPTVKLEVEQRP